MTDIPVFAPATFKLGDFVRDRRDGQAGHIIGMVTLPTADGGGGRPLVLLVKGRAGDPWRIPLACAEPLAFFRSPSPRHPYPLPPAGEGGTRPRSGREGEGVTILCTLHDRNAQLVRDDKGARWRPIARAVETSVETPDRPAPPPIVRMTKGGFTVRELPPHGGDAA